MNICLPYLVLFRVSKSDKKVLLYFQFVVEVNERRDLLFFYGADLMPTVMNPKKLEFATW